MRFKWVKDFSAERKTINLSEEIRREFSNNIRVGKPFKTLIQNPKAIPEIVDKFNSLKK